MSSTINTTAVLADIDSAEKAYLNQGYIEGDFRMIEKLGAKSIEDFFHILNENATNMYARDFNLTKRGILKPTVLRNWTGVSTNFERWVFERIDDNMTKAMTQNSSNVGACVIPKHYMIKKKVEAELHEVMDYLDADTPFHNKLKEHLKTKYPTLHTLIEFKMIMGDKKGDMVMPTLSVIFIKKN
jgi:hypothetical protein